MPESSGRCCARASRSSRASACSIKPATEPRAMQKSTVGVRPLFGLGAVLFGAFISTLSGRLSSLGLADIRGGLGLGFDEAAWIGTAQGVGQMLVAPLAVWAAAVVGPRRVLLAACV